MLRKFGIVTDLDALQFADQSNVSKVEFLRTGEWLHPVYGKLSITKAKLENFVKNFNDKVRQALPIDIEHKTDQGAVGWVQNVSVEPSTDDGKVFHLFGDVEWTPEGRELIKSKKFRFFSAEFKDNYKDKKTGNVINDVLMGGAITTRPFMEELAEVVVLSEDARIKISSKKEDSHMLLSEIIAALKADAAFKLSDDASESDKTLLTEAQAVMKEHADALTAKDAEITKLNEKVTTMTADAEKKLAELNQETTKILGEIGVKTLDDAKALATKMAEQKKADVKTQLSEFVLPKNLDAAVDFAMTLSDDARAKYIELAKNEEAAKMFKELGKDGGEGDDDTTKTPEGVSKESAELDKKARKYLAEHKADAEFKGLSESEAYHKAVYAVSGK